MNIKFKIGIILVLLMATLAMQNTATAQLKAETAEQKAKRMEWWTDARFGMFIHWGLYALPARHEWVKQYEQIPDDVYEKYFRHFDPDLYDPELWAKAGSHT